MIKILLPTLLYSEDLEQLAQKTMFKIIKFNE